MRGGLYLNGLTFTRKLFHFPLSSTFYSHTKLILLFFTLLSFYSFLFFVDIPQKLQTTLPPTTTTTMRVVTSTAAHPNMIGKHISYIAFYSVCNSHCFGYMLLCCNDDIKNSMKSSVCKSFFFVLFHFREKRERDDNNDTLGIC